MEKSSIGTLSPGRPPYPPGWGDHCAVACGYKSLVLRLVQQGLGHRGFRRSQLGSHFANFLVFDMATFFDNVLMMNFVLFMVLAVAMAMVDDGCDVSTPRC